jgi:hypothetical protein
MDYQIKKFVFTVGPPGSGKSTTFPDAYEADKFTNLYSRSGHINIRFLQSAHSKCLEDCIKDMIKGLPLVVQSNTNLNPKNLISYLDACVQYGYEVFCILPKNDLLHFNADHLNSRSRQIQHLIETRSKGVRVIPEEAIYRMVNQFDEIKSFYQKLACEKNPIKWIEAINNPFLDFCVYTFTEKLFNNESIDSIKTDEDFSFYTPFMEKLIIISEEKSDMMFRVKKMIQLKNRSLAVIIIVSEIDNYGYIILWNDGHNLKNIDRFIMSQF